MYKKKGLSNLVAYVLLIAITISLSVMIYNWLQFYVQEDGTEACQDGVNIVIDSYNCTMSPRNINVTVKNKGRFSVDGFILRSHNRSGAEFGVYLIDDVPAVLAPGESYTDSWPFVGDNLTLIDAQPFLEDAGERTSCESYSSQKVSCS